MKILTGKNPSILHLRYAANVYPAPAFRKLGHTVDETGLYREGYDLGFIVENQRREKRKWLGYPVGFWCIDSGAYIDRYLLFAEDYDYMFVDIPDVVEWFKTFSRKTVYLPYACDPKMHRAVATEETFDIGYVGKQAEYREEPLEILKKNGLKVCVYFNNKLQNNDNPLIPWRWVCRLYSRCKMIFNSAKPSCASLNKRVFEGMSIGKLVLTNRAGSEPDNLFEDGKHLVAYDGIDDLVEKAKYYATYPTERQAIAEAGQKLVHEKHKWTNRMQFVIETLKG